MSELIREINLIFNQLKGVNVLFWDPAHSKLGFYGEGEYEVDDWKVYLGSKLEGQLEELTKKGVYPVTLDDIYIHCLVFYAGKKQKKFAELFELFSQFYYGHYLKSGLKRSSELRKYMDKIFRYKSPKKIAEGFAEACMKSFGAESYEFIYKKKLRNAYADGSLLSFAFYCPLRIDDIRGIKILNVKKILPNQISFRYIQNFANMVQYFAQFQSQLMILKNVHQRYKFLGEFSQRFHNINGLKQLAEYVKDNLPLVIDVEEIGFNCFHDQRLPADESELTKGRDSKKGFLEKKIDNYHHYSFPIKVADKLAAVIRIKTKDALSKDDIAFLMFLKDEVEVIIGLHAVNKIREQKVEQLETAYEIANLYPFLSSTGDAFGVLSERICKKVNFDFGGFVVVDADEFVVMRPAYGLDKVQGPISLKINETEVGYSVYHSRKPFYSNRVEDLSFVTRRIVTPLGIDKIVFLPLIFRDEVIGLFVAGRKIDNPNITDDDVVLMTILVNQAAVLIQGLRSSEDQSRQIQELKLINEISRIANSTLYLNEIVKLSLQKIRSFVTHSYISILVYNEFSNNLELMGHLGFELPDPSYRFVKPGIGIVGNAAMLRMPIVVDDVVQDNRYIMMLKDVRAELAVPIIFQGSLLGIIDIQSTEPNSFKPYEVGLLETIANQLASAIANAQLHERVEETLTDAVRALVMTIDASDPYTRGHSERVTDYAVELAIELGLPKEEIEKIKKAALLHDIGKIGISELILLKKEKLSSEEMDEVKLHPLLGAQMLDGVRGFEEVRSLIKSHHEGYNGDGYPYGLRGEEIPLGARIITVVDVYEALTSDRPYRPAYSKSQAVEILKSEAGGHLDPKLVELFIKILNRKE